MKIEIPEAALTRLKIAAEDLRGWKLKLDAVKEHLSLLERKDEELAAAEPDSVDPLDDAACESAHRIRFQRDRIKKRIAEVEQEQEAVERQFANHARLAGAAIRSAMNQFHTELLEEAMAALRPWYGTEASVRGIALGTDKMRSLGYFMGMEWSLSLPLDAFGAQSDRVLDWCEQLLKGESPWEFRPPQSPQDESEAEEAEEAEEAA